MMKILAAFQVPSCLISYYCSNLIWIPWYWLVVSVKASLFPNISFQEAVSGLVESEGESEIFLVACKIVRIRCILLCTLKFCISNCSNLASVTVSKRIETPHSLCCDFGGYKTFTTRWSGGTVQVWVQVWAPASDLAISPKAVPESNWRFRGQNQRSSSWGRSPALLAWVGRASTNCDKHIVFPSQWDSTGSLEENMLPLLWCYWLISRVNKVLMLCKFRAATTRSHFLSSYEMKFPWNWREVVADQGSAHSFAQSFYHSLVSE